MLCYQCGGQRNEKETVPIWSAASPSFVVGLEYLELQKEKPKKTKPNCLSEDGEEMEKGPDGHNCGMFLGTKGLGEVPLGVPGGYQT